MKLKWILLASALFATQGIASDLVELYKQDQAVRAHLQTLPKGEFERYIAEVMLPGDKIRMSKVEEILRTSKNLSSEEYFAAAMIMQHGSTPSHYKKAMELSQKAVQLDPNNKNASWLSCAAEDRYLKNIGKPQVWGTQLSRKMNSSGTYEIYYLENFDKHARSDEERVKCGIPTLSGIKSKLERMAKLEDRNAQYRLWKSGN